MSRRIKPAVERLWEGAPTRSEDAYGAHLEACRQCRVKPFNLCEKGAVLHRATPAVP